MLQVKSELPSTFNTYRNQQHRWSCGPANLFRKMFLEILRNKVLLIDLFGFLIIHVYIKLIYNLVRAHAEFVSMDKALYSVQLLLHKEDRGAYSYIRVLLCCTTCYSISTPS